MNNIKKTFASDNYAGVHPSIMEALVHANNGHVGSYGADPFTAGAIEKFKEIFGNDIEVFFVYNGIGANVLALSAITNSYNSILCADGAHINVDESTAPEKFTGCKLIPIPTETGKLYPDQVELKIQRIGDQHHPQVKALSISQSTEYGTVYSIEELKALSLVAKKNNLYFHMDGSRISNAAVSLNADFKVFTKDAGLDIISFGGTKNGLMFGEAVIFFNTDLAKNFVFQRKQGMQLHSKMRFISAQFQTLLTGRLWEQNAKHANAMAKMLEAGLRKFPAIKITQSVDANGIFALFPPEIISTIQQTSFFYVWNERLSEVRLMCSWDTTEDDIKQFLQRLDSLIS